jgi:hypothetical protein
MLEGIAFVAIITAAITSTFVARAERERGLEVRAGAGVQEAWAEARFAELAERLDRLELLLAELAARSPGSDEEPTPRRP